MAQRFAAQLASRNSKYSAYRHRLYHATAPSFAAQALKKKHLEMSDLGLRSRLPPDSNSKPDPNNPSQMSDQDWEIRTGSSGFLIQVNHDLSDTTISKPIGRAIYVLQHTLPDFFHTGLITSIDKATGTLRPSESIPTVNANPLDNLSYEEDSESIYSPKIRLSYTPPVALPPPFPKTLHIEGQYTIALSYNLKLISCIQVYLCTWLHPSLFGTL